MFVGGLRILLLRQLFSFAFVKQGLDGPLRQDAFSIYHLFLKLASEGHVPNVVD